jgi:hypothetical protein
MISPFSHIYVIVDFELRIAGAPIRNPKSAIRNHPP